jgi:hypothetical protein
MKKSVETFVAECPVCQRSKSKTCQYPGLLSPLPIPDVAWSFISMDFVESLLKSGGKDTILVVVDRLTKFAHFIVWAHPSLLNLLSSCSLIKSSNCMAF